MPLAIDEFRVLLVDSGLFTADEVRRHVEAFAALKGAADRGSSSALAQWLIARGLLTRYQAKKLVSGHRQKFVYGDYVIQERIREGPRAGLLRAMHRPSGGEVHLYFRDRDTPPGSRKTAAALREAVIAEGQVRTIQAATLGCYQWHDVGKSRVIALEATGADRAWQIFARWLRPQAESATIPPQVAVSQVPSSVQPPMPPATAAPAIVQDAPVGLEPIQEPSPLVGEGRVEGRFSDKLLARQVAAGPQAIDAQPHPVPAIAARTAVTRRSRRTGPPPVWLAALAGAAVAVLGVGAWMWYGGLLTGAGLTSDAGEQATVGTGDAGPSSPDAIDAPNVEQSTTKPAPKEIQRDASLRAVGAPLWLSPTAGQPLDLKYLPPGVQMVIALRPAELIAQPEAPRLFDARTLGPLNEWFTVDLPRLAGQPLANIEQAIIGLLDSGAGPPRMAMVVRLRERVPEGELIKVWGAAKNGPLTPPSPAGGEGDRPLTPPTPTGGDGERPLTPPSPAGGEGKLYEREGRAWFLPSGEATTTIVLGPAEEIKQVAAGGGATPPLQRELESLLAASDAQRHMTVLFAPRFLFTGGKELLSGPAARLKDPLDWFFSGHEAGIPAANVKPAQNGATAATATGEVELSGLNFAKGALVSLHLGDNLFAELRVVGVLDRSAAVVAEDFRQRVARVPKEVDRYVRSLALSEYGYDVLWQFPRMVEQLERFTTAGFDGKQVVLRVYLPAVAAHNLALGTHLALLESPRTAASGQRAAVGATPGNASASGAAADTAGAGTAAERLRRRISLVFPATTLDKALQSLGEEVGLPVVILGADLQLEGITKNQSFALDERDQPAIDILRKIMLRANPDGKLVYVIKAKEGGAEEALYITTRAAAAKRGDTLPAELAK